MIPKVKMQPDLGKYQEPGRPFSYSTADHLPPSCKAVSRLSPCSADYKWLCRRTSKDPTRDGRNKSDSERDLLDIFCLLRKRMKTAKWNDGIYAHQMIHFKTPESTA